LVDPKTHRSMFTCGYTTAKRWGKRVFRIGL